VPKLRDGFELEYPALSAEHDVEVIGGGPSALCFGYRLRGEGFSAAREGTAAWRNCHQRAVAWLEVFDNEGNDDLS
jgi:hypothetical protein